MKSQKYKLSSAQVVMFSRAWDNCHPPDARVCDDTVAVKLVKPGVRFFAKTAIGRRLLLKMLNPCKRAILGYVPLRTRLIDERLQAALDDGLEQLVILGSGYDTRAYRLDDLRKGTKVFELDRAAIQSEKKARVEKALGSVPDHVAHVPVDFEKDDIGECLFENGYNANRKTFFILEGVTYFLDAEAVDRTLAFVAERSGPGSVIMFDYVPPNVIDGTNENPMTADLLDAAMQLGEPYNFGIEPASIATFLSQRGFSDTQDYSAPQLVQRYHNTVHKERSVMDVYHVVCAVARPR